MIGFMALGIIIFRWSLNNGDAWFPPADNPATVFLEFKTRFLTFSWLAGYHYYLLFYPFKLCCDYGINTIALIENFDDSRIILIITFYIFLFLYFIIAFFATKY